MPLPDSSQHQPLPESHTLIYAPRKETKLLKAFMLFLFILLPFLGFYAGIQYQQRLAPTSDSNPNTAYYQTLRDQCHGNGCCLASLLSMETNGYKLAQNGTCLPGMNKNGLLCPDSYQWCEPDLTPTINPSLSISPIPTTRPTSHPQLTLRNYNPQKAFGFGKEPYPSELINVTDDKLIGIQCHTYEMPISNQLHENALKTFITNINGQLQQQNSNNQLSSLISCITSEGKTFVIYGYTLTDTTQSVTRIAHLYSDGQHEEVTTIRNDEEMLFGCGKIPLALTNNNELYLTCEPGSCYGACSRSIYKINLDQKTSKKIYGCYYSAQEPDDDNQPYPTPITSCQQFN